MTGVKKFTEASDKFLGVAADVLNDASDIGIAGKMTAAEVVGFLDVIYRGQQSIKLMMEKGKKKSEDDEEIGSKKSLAERMSKNGSN